MNYSYSILYYVHRKDTKIKMQFLTLPTINELFIWTHHSSDFGHDKLLYLVSTVSDNFPTLNRCDKKK